MITAKIGAITTKIGGKKRVIRQITTFVASKIAVHPARVPITYETPLLTCYVAPLNLSLTLTLVRLSVNPIIRCSINAAFHWPRKLAFPNLYFRVGSRGARRIPSFPLGNTTSDFNGTIFPTGKLVNTSFRAQWNAA